MKKILYSPRFALFRFVCIAIGCILLLVSWWKSLMQTEKTAVVFLIDSSFSMSVADIVDVSQLAKTRMDVAKNIATNIAMAGKNSMAVATFSREMTLQLPLTDDFTLIQNVISGLFVDKYGGGSDIYQAISRIFGIYQHHKNVHIVVLSDMETFEEHSNIPLRPSSVSLTFVGIGTKKGGRMLEGYTTNGQPVYRMFGGENAISVLDEKILTMLTEQFSAVSMTVEKGEDIAPVIQDIMQNIAQKGYILPFDFFKIAGCLILLVGIIFPVYVFQKSGYEK